MKALLIPRFDWRVWLGLGATLLLAWAAYLPGLSGGFLFDDFVNLDALGNHGRIDNWPKFWIYITSGTADPLGRPLALLSFLIDGRDWPTAPLPFLRTNVILHLINGGLLFGLLRALGQIINLPNPRNNATALLASGLWLLHPLFVSTTLYVVQREAMLPATFTLLGLWIFIDGRARYLRSLGDVGMARMLVGVTLGTGLAMLCKANGILLPLLAWILVATIFRNSESCLVDSSAYLRLRWLDRGLLVIPSLVVLGYLLRLLPHIHDPLASRPWTIGERLLTEPRILVDYLGLLAVPRSVSTGLFNDDYLVSTDWLRPTTTLPAILIVAGLIVLGFRYRSRAPLLAAALLFYFAGHVLESTTVPLELYFEHRNYLPAMLLFWPLAHMIVHWKASSSARMAVALALLALFAATTWQRATLWGQPDRLAALWVARNPDSPRTQASAALQMMKSGKYQQAAVLLRFGMQKNPGEVQLAFNFVNARCAQSGLTANDWQAVTATIVHAKAGHLLINQWLSHAMTVAADQSCPGLTLDVTGRWVVAAMSNPALAAAGRREEDFEPLLGELAVHQGDPDRALVHFRRALLAHVNPDFAARMVAFLADHEDYRQALALLDTYEQNQQHASSPGFSMVWLHAKVLERQGYWPRELAALRSELVVEMARKNAMTTTP